MKLEYEKYKHLIGKKVKGVTDLFTLEVEECTLNYNEEEDCFTDDEGWVLVRIEETS